MKGFIKEQFEDMLNVPEWVTIFSITRKAIRDGKHSQSYIDMIFQPYRSPTISDIIAFAHIHYHLCSGNIALATITVGNQPSADKDIAGNNERLSRLEYPFRAKFAPQYGGGAEDDGTFFIDEPIVIETSTDIIIDYETGEYNREDKYLLWDTVGEYIPLEVGHTGGHITWYHLIRQGMLA